LREFSKICTILVITLLASSKLSGITFVWHSNENAHYSQKSENPSFPIVLSQISESETNDSSDDDENEDDAGLDFDQNLNTSILVLFKILDLNFSLSQYGNQFSFSRFIRFRNIRI
jgi:hypothetical protein